MSESDTESSPEGFEASLSALEDRVRRLERGEVPLDDALNLFEEGVVLAKRCHEHLDAAEERVAQLMRTRAGFEEKPLKDVE